MFRFRRIFVATLGCVALATGSSLAQGASPPGEPICEFRDADAQWVQRALDGWELVRRDFLKLEPRPLPWIILFDAACVWDLAPAEPPLVPDATMLSTSLTFAGGPVSVRATPHTGTVLLPNRVEIPIEVKASTALYRNGRATFFVMSMPSVWRSDRRHGTKPFLDEYLQGVFVHELTHTAQLVPINRRLRQLVGRSDVPAQLTDDVIQARFSHQRGFGRAIQRERDQFYRAIATSNPALQRDLVRKTLALVRDRHARYFTQANEVYEEIESLFLTMEGAAQWAAYRLARARGRAQQAPQLALNLVRDDSRYWSQEQGLALFLLLDALVPNWQDRVMTRIPPSPFALLEEAVSSTQ